MSIATKTKRAWTDEEIGFLESAVGMSANDVAAALGRSIQSVRGKRHQIRSGWSRRREPWTSEEDELLRTTKTAAEIAELLPGRTAKAVNKRRFDLGIRVGIAITRDPSALGARRLLAKTCLICGQLMDSGAFYFDVKNRKWSSRCRWCAKQDPADRAYAKDVRARARNNTKARQWRSTAQAITLRNAEKNREPWTEADDAVLRNPDMSTIEKALLLRRTYSAVGHQLHERGYKFGARLGDPATHHWSIENPNVDHIEEIRAILKRRNVELPSRFTWDWDD